jgi:UDP-glucose 4-epimerase
LPHRVLNVGSGRGVPVRALVKELIAVSGCAVTVHEDALNQPRSADIPWQQADISRASSDLRWRPRRDLVTSLADLWAAAG